jgi:monovalent cation:H+ antiporter-2, CPA2 family
MPHGVTLITTMVAGFGLALVLGYAATLIKLPPLVGYLLAGVLLGPATPGIVADIDLAQQLAEIGVILLMFGVGLHFSLDDLLSVRRIAVPGAVGQITVTTLLCVAVARLWGWSAGAGVVFGLSLAVASTVVVLRMLGDRGSLATMTGTISVGWLVVEDLAVILVLVLLPPVAGALGGTPADGSSSNLLLAVGWTFVRVALFVVFMLVVARRILPWLLWRVAGAGSRELFTLAVVVVGLGVAYGSARLFGVSFALGAFFGGMVLGESALSHRAAEESLPLRDAFAVLFFVSVGMLFDPRILLHDPVRVLVTVGIVVVAKSVAGFAIVAAFRYPLDVALTVGVALAQIGEFSFILVGLGRSLGLLPAEATDLVLAAAIISIALNPVLFHLIEPLRRVGERWSARGGFIERSGDVLAQLPNEVQPERLNRHVVLIGYGRVGRRIGEALRAKRRTFVVAEQNREAVEQLRREGLLAVSGDAGEAAVLVQAHIARASMLVIATPDVARARKMIDIARRLNPRVETIVRTHSDEEAELMRRERASAVFMGEHELATSMIARVMQSIDGQDVTAPRGE